MSNPHENAARVRKAVALAKAWMAAGETAASAAHYANDKAVRITTAKVARVSNPSDETWELMVIILETLEIGT